MSRSRLIVSIVTLVLAARSTSAAVSPDWAAQWRADLVFLADTLPKIHPAPFHSVAREHFRAELDSLSERVSRLDHETIVVELARIVALIGDGHTRLTLPFDSTAGFFTGHASTAKPLVPGLVFKHLPVRLHLFDDGLFVVRVDARHRDLLGGRVITIGGMPAEQAMAAIEPTVQRDNAQQVRGLLPVHLVVPEILKARGVVEDARRVRFVVEMPNGARREVVLSPFATGRAPVWIDARPASAAPWIDRHPSRHHWFARIPGTQVIYARYREVVDDDDESVEDFATRLFAALGADAGADHLILDLRGNPGGYGQLNRPMFRGLITAPALQRPGAMFVLADRGTFSAAMMLLSDLEQRTPAVIVGETIGARPNGYGDSRRVRLPQTGLTVRISTLYWQTGDPRDTRDGITPHVAVETRFADWRAGRDAAIDTVLAMVRAAPEPAGNWTGIIGAEYQRIPLALHVAPEAGDWAVRVDSPALGLDGSAMEKVKFVAGELSFEGRVDGTPLTFRARVSPGAIVGILHAQGADYPFVLRRAD